MKKMFNILCSIRGTHRFALLVMRLTLFLLLVLMFNVHASSYSQAAKFSLSLKNASIEDVFREIESNSEFIIFFQDQNIDLNRKVNIRVKNKSVEEILKQTFSGTDNKWEVEDRQITVYKKDALLIPITNAVNAGEQQTKQVTGTVSDENGLPIPGASISVKGTTFGTITNAEGKFSISIPENKNTLTISFVGMKTQEVLYSGQPTIKVTLVTDVTQMEEVEVVVAALGIKRQAKSMGYITQSIGGKNLVQSNTPNVVSALSGKLAGVNITN